MKKTKRKNFIQALTFAITMAIVIAIMPLSAFAVTVTIGSDATADYTNTQFYVLGSSNVTTYTTASATTVAGAIYPDDLCTVLDATGTYWKVSYPTSSGTKIAYCNKSNILSSTSYCKRITIAANTTVYRKSDMSTSFGTAYTTDTIYMLCPISNGKAQIIYNISGGHKIGWIYASTASTTRSMSSVLYGNSTISSKLTCGFDGYVTTPGRHEGIDFAYGQGRTIYSLIDGQVVNVVQGSSGTSGTSGSLSTIAIYDSAANKTVIYLHSAPSVSIGDRVYVGSVLGTEDKRGATAIHTHVEVRDGQRTLAAYSSDSTLDNPDPTPYWTSKSYSIQ